MGQPQQEDIQAFDDRVQELVQYARERQGEERSALFTNLVDMFVSGNAPRRIDAREQLLDVLEALIPHVDGEVRRLTADQLADADDRPMDMVFRLVHDRASIVASLIRKAPFEEDEFIDLIRATGREHHQELAARHDLPANVWIELARAAPNAPVGETPSTLALWEDDLGKRKELRARKSKVNLRTEDGKVTLFRRQQDDENIIPAAADIAHQRAQETVNEMVSVLSDEELGELGGEVPADDWVHDLPVDPEPTRDFEHSIDAMHSIVAGEADLKDPCPGGWSWASDAIGKVVALSAGAHALFGDYSLRLLGGEVADLLGLGERRSHPILKALERRGAIHDAPVLLREMVPGKRNWSLEARPRFSLQGGRFEGYEGEMIPVAAAEADRFADMMKKDVATRPRVSSEMKESLRDLERELREAKVQDEARKQREAEFAAAAAPKPVASKPVAPKPAAPVAPAPRSEKQSTDTNVKPAGAVAGDTLKLRELMAPPGQTTVASNEATILPPPAEEPALKVAKIVRKKSRPEPASDKPVTASDMEAVKQRALALKDIEKALRAEQAADEEAPAQPAAPAFLKQRQTPPQAAPVSPAPVSPAPAVQAPANDQQKVASADVIPAAENEPAGDGPRDTFELPRTATGRASRRRDNMFNTLNLMGEAGGRLKSTNRQTDPRSVVLDAEIIDSCIRALRELLEEDALEADLENK